MSLRHAFSFALLVFSPISVPPIQAQSFDVVETPILDMAEAQAVGKVTARALVEAYLARIAAYDWAGPELHSIVTVNPQALEEADRLDRERQAGRGSRTPSTASRS